MLLPAQGFQQIDLLCRFLEHEIIAKVKEAASYILEHYLRHSTLTATTWDTLKAAVPKAEKNSFLNFQALVDGLSGKR